jgi:hypothetical protein
MTPGAHQNIVTAAARGDDAALTLLIRAYHDRVYRFGQRVCRDSFDADDAVQEAFVALARRPDVARHRGVLSWLMTAVPSLQSCGVTRRKACAWTAVALYTRTADGKPKGRAVALKAVLSARDREP